MQPSSVDHEKEIILFYQETKMAKSKKWVYLFQEVEEVEKYAGSWEGVRALLGGKGSGLADMTRAGVPVPPGFTVTTEACNEFRKTGQFP
jgi:pyruvate,orthophosphate dikinase